MLNITRCIVCGGNEFTFNKVLSNNLILDWELSVAQTEYIDFQQGFCCNTCSSNVRTMLLAKSVMRHFSYDGFFSDMVKKKNWLFGAKWQTKTFLEINKAGLLHCYLSQLKCHKLLEYPEIDITDISIDDNSVDCIIHSDTLEHITDSILALKECYRVLKPRGVLFFTIPIIHEKLTRKRYGLKKSYHGDYTLAAEDLIVYTEYGSNFYNELFEAGFDDIKLTSLLNCGSFAISCIKY